MSAVVQLANITSNTVVADANDVDITDLVLPLEASKTYLVRFHGTVTGCLFAFKGPAGSTGVGRLLSKSDPSTTGLRPSADIVWNAKHGSAVGHVSSPTVVEAWILVTTDVTAGDFSVNLASFGGGPSHSTLYAGSSLEVREVDGTTVDCTTGNEATTSATLVNTTLALAVEANKTYLVRFYGRAVANGTNFRVGFTAPAGATIGGWHTGFGSAAGTETNRQEITALATATTNTSGNGAAIGGVYTWVRITTAGTSGTVTLQMASSAGTTITLQAGAILTCDEIAVGASGDPSYDQLASQFSTTADTAQNTDLSLAVLENTTYIVRCYMTVDAPAGGMKFALDCPAGSTIEGWVLSTQASLITNIVQRITTEGTLTASHACTIRGVGFIYAVVTVGGTAGNITLQACSTTATQTTIIDASSTLEIVSLAPPPIAIEADAAITFGAMTCESRALVLHTREPRSWWLAANITALPARRR